MSWFSLYVVNHAPWFWLGVMILCLLIESFTLALTTVWFACGALAMVFVSFLPLPFRWQLLLFLLISCALLVWTRPAALRHFKLPASALNSDSLVGRKVLLTEAVSAHQKGAAKVKGVVWSVASGDGSPLAAGTECLVTAIEGATLIVAPVAAEASAAPAAAADGGESPAES